MRKGSAIPLISSTVDQSVPKAIFGRHHSPLPLGRAFVHCYVLDDGTRVITDFGLKSAVGLSRGRNATIRTLLADLNLTEETVASKGIRTLEPIRFRRPDGPMAFGYDCRLLPRICAAVVRAARAGTLPRKKLHLVPQCEEVVCALADVGIVALIDAHTGYESQRGSGELHDFLRAYIGEEFLPYSSAFPMEFFTELARLKGWPFDGKNLQALPRSTAYLINDIVYDRLPPGVFEELRTRNPVVRPKSQRRYRHHQALTPDVGRGHLERHIAMVMGIMRCHATWPSFVAALNTSRPKNDGARQYLLLDPEAGRTNLS